MADPDCPFSCLRDTLMRSRKENTKDETPTDPTLMSSADSQQEAKTRCCIFFFQLPQQCLLSCRTIMINRHCSTVCLKMKPIWQSLSSHGRNWKDSYICSKFNPLADSCCGFLFFLLRLAHPSPSVSIPSGSWSHAAESSSPSSALGESFHSLGDVFLNWEIGANGTYFSRLLGERRQLWHMIGGQWMVSASICHP